MTKSININRLNLEVDDEYLEAAETIFGNQELLDFEKSDNLYYAQYSREPLIVCELTMNGNHAVKYKCDCKTYYKNKICSHIIATLLKIKQDKDLKKEEKEAVKILKKEAPTADTILIDNVFSNTNIYDLQHFIKDIARKDRSVNLLLKATFISKIQQENNTTKYKMLWQSVENFVIEKNNRLLPKAKQLLKKILETQVETIELAMSENDFNEAVPCLIVACESTLMIVRKTNADISFFSRQFQKIVTSFLELSEKTLTFTTKELLINFALQKIHRKDYKYLDLNTSLIIVCQKLMTSYEKNELLLEKLLDTNPDDSSFYTQNMVFATVHYFENDASAKAFDIIEAQLQNFEYLYQLSSKLFVLAKFELVEEIIAIMNTVSDTHNDMAEKIELELAIYRNDTKNIDNQAMKMFLETYDLKYFDIMKINARKKWPRILENIMTKLQKQTFSTAKRDILGYIYFTEYNREALVEYLKVTISVDLTLQYTSAIVFQFPDETLDIYKTWAMQYLNQHLGLQGAKRIKEVMSKLFEMGHIELVRNLRDVLYTEFPNRTSIKDVLEDILSPKKKRNFDSLN